MKRYLVFTTAFFIVSGCSGSVVTQINKVTAEPPDAAVRIVSDIEQREKKYVSPDVITAGVYRPRFRLFESTERDKLNNPSRFQSLTATEPDEIKFRDRLISVSFGVAEQVFQMNLVNLSAHPLKILWNLAEYTDVNSQRHRLIHSGIRYQDRNNPISDQIVASGGSLQEAIIPIEHVYVNPHARGYKIEPLFNLNGDGALRLKGKTINLFVPIEINRSIIPYNFKFVIIDLIKMTIKNDHSDAQG